MPLQTELKINSAEREETAKELDGQSTINYPLKRTKTIPFMTDFLRQHYASDLLDELEEISLKEANAEHIALKIKGLAAHEQAKILTFLRVNKKDDPELIPFLTELLYHLTGGADAELSLNTEEANIATAARLGFTRAQAYFKSRLSFAAELEPQATELDGQIRGQIAKVEKATKQALLRQLMKRIAAALAKA